MIEIVITDIKNKKRIIEGVDNVYSAELLLPPLIKIAFDAWREQPAHSDSSTIDSLLIEWLGLSYVFHDHYWD